MQFCKCGYHNHAGNLKCGRCGRILNAVLATIAGQQKAANKGIAK